MSHDLPCPEHGSSSNRVFAEVRHPPIRRLLKCLLSYIGFGAAVFWAPDVIVHLIRRHEFSAKDVYIITLLLPITLLLGYVALLGVRFRRQKGAVWVPLAALLIGGAGILFGAWSGAWSLLCSGLSSHFHLLCLAGFAVWFGITRYLRLPVQVPISLSMSLGVWLLGPMFMFVGATGSGGGLASVHELWVVPLFVVYSFTPSFAFIGATYDGSLAALMTASAVMLMLLVVIEMPVHLRARSGGGA
jgi:hypothetical protein